MSKTPRAYRVSEKIRSILAVEVLKAGDPRLALISITAVTVSPDLREASVYWNIFGGKEKMTEATQGLDSINSRMKSILAKKLESRFVPNLRFIYDNTADTIEEVEELINRINKKDAQ